MPTFRYRAQGEQGQPVEGNLAARDADDARQQLLDQGWEPLQIETLDADSEAAPERLTRREAEDVMAQLAELSSARLPLASGLRAAASESTNRRIAGALRCIARDVDQGKSIEDVLRDRRRMLPDYVSGLVQAATRTGRLGVALDELVEHQRLVRDVTWSVIGALAYPLVVLTLTLSLVSLMPLFIVPQFKRMFEEFELELPFATQWLIQISDMTIWCVRGGGAWIVLIGLAVVVVLYVGIPGVVRAAHGRRILATVPLFGVLWIWSSAARFARLLAVLVDNGITLPDALRLTGNGVGDANIREVCEYLREGVQQGHALSELMIDTPRLPASLVPLVRWGEKTGDLAEALRSGSEMLMERIRMRAVLLRSVSPPVVFVLVFLAVGFMVISLFMPLIALIQGLT